MHTAMDAFRFDFDDSPATQDCLGFQEPAENLARQLASSRLPLVLGLFGRWGCGKSSFLEMLVRALEAVPANLRRMSPVAFEPWKLQDSSTILHDLVSAIHLTVTKDTKLSSQSDDCARQLFSHLGGLTASSLREMLLSGAGHLAESRLALGKEVRTAIHKMLRTPPERIAQSRVQASRALSGAYAAYLRSLPTVPVVVIDDLDRCSPAVVGRVLEALKLYLSDQDAPALYILAMDHQMVVSAVCAHCGFEDWKDGWQYLSKICSVNYFVPRPHLSALTAHLTAEMRKDHDGLNGFWKFLSEEETERLLYRSDLYLPRRVKRVVRELHMALSLGAHGLVRIVRELADRYAEEDRIERLCYRLLLGVFLLREAYPEVYSQIVYRTHTRRVDLLFALAEAAVIAGAESRTGATAAVLQSWCLSGLAPYFSETALLDLVVVFFSQEDYGTPAGARDGSDATVPLHPLNALLDQLMES